MENRCIVCGEPVLGRFSACPKCFKEDKLVVCLGLSLRVENSLLRAGIVRTSDLVSMGESDLYYLRGMGRKGLSEVKECLIERDLRLNRLRVFRSREMCIVGSENEVKFEFTRLKAVSH